VEELGFVVAGGPAIVTVIDLWKWRARTASREMIHVILVAGWKEPPRLILIWQGIHLEKTALTLRQQDRILHYAEALAVVVSVAVAAAGNAHLVAASCLRIDWHRCVVDASDAEHGFEAKKSKPKKGSIVKLALSSAWRERNGRREKRYP